MKEWISWPAVIVGVLCALFLPIPEWLWGFLAPLGSLAFFFLLFDRRKAMTWGEGCAAALKISCPACTAGPGHYCMPGEMLHTARLIKAWKGEK